VGGLTRSDNDNGKWRKMQFAKGMVVLLLQTPSPSSINKSKQSKAKFASRLQERMHLFTL
jgi:hypothetical protein